MSQSFEEEITDMETKWCLAIGRLLVAFGKIEWFTYFLLCELPSEDIFDSVCSLSFSKRRGLIEQLAEQRITDSGLKAAILGLLKDAEKYSKIRNTVAHNPIELSLFDSSEGIDLRHTISKFRADMDERRKTEITLAELEEKCVSIERLAGKCYEMQYKVDEHLFT